MVVEFILLMVEAFNGDVVGARIYQPNDEVNVFQSEQHCEQTLFERQKSGAWYMASVGWKSEYIERKGKYAIQQTSGDGAQLTFFCAGRVISR